MPDIIPTAPPETPGFVTIPIGRFKNIIDCCKRIQERIPCNGVPELDVEFIWMIGEMEKELEDAAPEPEQLPT